eukprot:CAMPEP_0201694210 /NCGR_PEP_ID=MMETSP0578-20130828/6554_1 /ASSEMBLY_ACC=CAM_ASM_000663 /TAXON_ID=267565 /ORGANISM="Skeletonema grethea, Strain CCMP 1804" /LENGTH=609 /DNA_ID=CAMNT_0048179857 /DNA_START=132 /DNA_END=1961 /DNA_ORIENTATION=+
MGNSSSLPNGDHVVDTAAAATAVYGSGSEIDSVDDRSATSVAESDDDDKEEEPDYTKMDILSKFDSDEVLEQHTSYSPPSSAIRPSVHYVFLVHGWLGNDLEMSYLAEAFHKNISGEEEEEEENGDNGRLHATKRVKRSRSPATFALQKESNNEEDTHPEIVVYSAKCNIGKTHDGIRNGGTRLANEIINFIQSDTLKRREEGDSGNDDDDDAINVTFSLVGNSLGGLYSRFALSKIPYEIPLSSDNSEDDSNSSSKTKIRLFPNIFCTTATPHLGISQHTYLPIPRLAETIIGTGMGATGRDLFRLNSDAMNDGAASKVNAAAAKTVKRLSSFRILQGSNANIEVEAEDEDESDCVVRNMCLGDEFLVPLRNFRKRIAYANAYGTDFQVPCQTAAFLNDNSGVCHFLIGARCLRTDGGLDENVEEGAERKRCDDLQADTGEEGAVPPFVVAVLRTDKQSQTQSPRNSSRQNAASDDLLQMSQSLDALGWTKVFVDMRDSIPVPGLRKPSWMCPDSLDDLIKKREEVSDDSEGEGSDEVKNKSLRTSTCRMLTSQDLSRSTAAGDSINIPLGHTVMVANSKSEVYKQMNFQGRPVMDKLAHDIVMSLEN